MNYLSKEIEAGARRKPSMGGSLIKKEKSCGIFQDYGTGDPCNPIKNKSCVKNPILPGTNSYPILE